MTPNNDLKLRQAQALTRRQFFGGIGLGLGTIALSALLEQNGRAAPTARAAGAGEALAPKAPMMPARAKAVIYLHMAGSPSQIDLFEYKPELTKYDGKDCPEEFLKGKRFAFIRGVPRMLGPLFKYAQYGQSGQWISELLPHLSARVDDICVIRSMY